MLFYVTLHHTISYYDIMPTPGSFFQVFTLSFSLSLSVYIYIYVLIYIYTYIHTYTIIRVCMYALMYIM